MVGEEKSTLSLLSTKKTVPWMWMWMWMWHRYDLSVVSSLYIVMAILYYSSLSAARQRVRVHFRFPVYCSVFVLCRHKYPLTWVRFAGEGRDQSPFVLYILYHYHRVRKVLGFRSVSSMFFLFLKILSNLWLLFKI
jgi:hypothetical protein